MKKVFMFALIISNLKYHAIFSQTTSATFDPTWASRFQLSIDNAINEQVVHGASVAVYFPGQGTFIGVGGVSKEGVPITADMQFCIGDNTKLFTTVILLKLQELGILSLDDPVYLWLPGYPNVNASATIRQLLSHQSGINDFFSYIGQEEFDSIVFGPDIFYNPEDVISLIGPSDFSPGEGFQYSNTNYILAGLIIEEATGKSYLENLHQFIFDPLDMDSTFLAAYESPNGNVAHGWYDSLDIGNIPLTAVNSMGWSAGAIYSTAKEMTEWFDHLFNHKTIINQSSLDQLVDIEPSSFVGLGIRIGYFHPEDDSYVLFGTDMLAGYNTCMGYDIKSGSVICIFVNEDDYYGAQVFNVLYPVLVTYFDNFIKQDVDAGISFILSPMINECEEDIFPAVVLQNYGLNDLTSATINYQYDQGPVNTFHWSGNLVTDDSFFIFLPQVILSPGTHEFTCYTSDPNGVTDIFSFNDFKETHFIVKQTPVTSLDEGFEGTEFPPSGWLNGLNATLNWGRSELSLLSGQACAVKNNFYDETGRNYDLELPMINLNTINNPVMSFYYASSNFPGDGAFAVFASSVCGTNYQELFYKEGEDLSTAPPTEDLFVPSDDQWKQVNLDLSTYEGNILLKFQDFSIGYNNIYIDDVRVGEGCPIPSDLSVSDVTATSALLSWNYSGQASSMDVYFKIDSSFEWMHINLSGEIRSINLDNLIPETSYQWYVTADCNFGTSPLSLTSSFLTMTTGLKDEYSLNQLRLFPNPANNTLILKWPNEEQVTIQILNHLGQVLSVENVIGHETNVNLEQFPSGIYIAKLTSKSHSDSKIFTIVK